MQVISIRVEDALHRRLKHRSAAANLSLSAFLRPLLEEAAWPGSRYVFTGQDELLGVAIQTFALVAELANAQSPALLKRATQETKRLLQERGLLETENASAPGDAVARRSLLNT